MQPINLDFTESGIDEVAGDMGSLIKAMEELRDTHKDFLAASHSVTAAVNAEARAYDRLAASASRANAVVAGGGSAQGAAAGGGAGGSAAMAGAAAVEGGPVTMIIGLALAGIAALAMAAKMSADRLNSFAQVMYATGATAAETARGQRIGAGLGIDFGSRAMAFGDSLNAGGPASFYARKYGINPIGNAMGQGNEDFAGKLIQGLSVVLGKGVSDREAMLAARAWGMTDILWARDASPAMKDKLMNHEARQYSAGERQLSADTQIAFNIALDDFKRVATEVAIHVLPLITAGLLMFSRLLEIIAERLHWISPEEAKDWKASNAGATKAQEDAKKARETASRDKHSDAMDRHTQAMNGTYGGGPRARGAVPAGWGYMHYDDAAKNQAIALGPFTL